MATLNTQSFTTLVSNAVTAVQGYARTLVDLSIGSVLRAVLEAEASVALWLQGLILQLLTTTRASTSVGADLDTWMADYGVTRLPAVKATGTVTLARFTPTNAATVAVGLLVQSADGSQRYAIVADTTQPTYSAAAGAYVIPAATSSATVTVQAVNAGSQGNAQAGQISALTQPIPGIDTVTNPSTFATGQDPETDAALRVRFIAYISSLSKATVQAVTYAVQSLSAKATAVIVENQTYAGATQLGYFFAVVNDGSGSPPAQFITNAGNAINLVRPLGSSFGVFGCVPVTATIAMTITTAAGYNKPSVVAQVQAALLAYIASLPQATNLPYTRLAQIAYDASPGVTNVSGVTLNGTTSDLNVTNLQSVVATLASVTVS